MKCTPILILAPLVVAACTATGSVTAGPSMAPSVKPSPSVSKTPSTDPVVAGDSKVSLRIDGTDIALGGKPRITNTDLMGRRLRIQAEAGTTTPTQAGEGGVSFLFSGGGATMYPGWDTTPQSTVYSVSVTDFANGVSRNFTLTGNTAKSNVKTLEAAGGHIKGTIDCTVRAMGGGVSGEIQLIPIVLTFDLVQVAL